MNTTSRLILSAFTCSLLACAGLTIGTSSASAAVLTDAGIHAPDASEVIFSIAATGDVYRTKYDSTSAGNRRDTGQTFKASDLSNYLLTGMVYQVGSGSSALGAGAPGASFTIKVFEFAGATSIAPIDMANPIYQDTGSLPIEIALGDYIRFDFAQTLELDPNKFYGIQLGFQSVDSKPFIDFVRGAAGTYTNGLSFNAVNTAVGGPPVSYGGTGFDYQIFLVTAAVPEPGSVTLGALVLIGFAFHRISRQRKIKR